MRERGKNRIHTERKEVNTSEYKGGALRARGQKREGLTVGETVGYAAKRAGTDFLRVGEGVVDAAIVPVDLMTGNVEKAKSRFMDSPIDRKKRELEEEYNPGKVAGFIGEVTGGIGQSIGYGLISAIPYAGKPMMYSSIVEQSISSAAEKTGEVGWKEVGYGATAGAVEGILESKLGAGVNAAKGIGSAILKKTGLNVAESAAKAGGKSLLKTLAIDTAKGFAGEFGEEFISEAVDPKLQNIWGIDKDARFSFKDSFRAGIVGGVSGGAISIGPSAINYRSAVSVGRALQESGLDGELINRAKYTLSALEAAQKRAEGQKKGKPEGDTKETAKEWLSRAAENRKVKRLSRETKELADKVRKNINAYESYIKDPRMAQSEPVAALLGELRGNLFLVGYAYEADVIEQVMMEADDKQRQAFVDAINEELAAQGKKHDYTLADFDANKDDIRRGLAGRLMMDELQGDTAESGAEATESPAEPAQAPQDTTAEQVDTQEENANTEDLSGIDEEVWRAVTDETVKGYGTQNEQEVALLRAAVSHGVPEKSIPLMLERFREGTDMKPAEFADAWADGVLFFGRLGLNEEKISQESALSRMSEKARRTSIEYGKWLSEEQRSKEQEAAKKKKRPVKEGESRKPKGEVVRHPGINLKADLDDAQFTAYKAAEIMAPALKADIEIHKGLERNGKQVNGYYDTKTNTIHINIDAVRDGKHIALYTLGHEVAHYIKAWSPKKFYELGDYVMDQLGEKAEKAVRDKLDFMKRNGLVDGLDETEAYDRAYEEVVADGMELVLTDGTVLDALARENKTLWQKIKDRIFEIIEKIKKAYSDFSKTSRTAQVLKETVESLEEIERLFTEGVTEAGERTRTAEAGVIVDDASGTAMLSVDDIPKTEKEINDAVNRLVQKLGVDESRARKWVEDEISLATLILRDDMVEHAHRKADRRLTAIVKNSDYKQGTLDFSNICRKRREYTRMMQRIQQAFPNRRFTAEEFATIRKIMVDEGLEVAFGLCYVEDRRQNEGYIAETFQRAVEAWRKGNRDTYYDTKNNVESAYNKGQAKAMAMLEGGDYVPTIADLTTVEGMNKLQAEHKDILQAWKAFNNARGMSSARLLTNEAEYQRQILKYNKARVKAINDLGGLRVFSFSDFEEFHLLDIIQAVQDCAAMGIKIQFYTKVPSFALLMKDTKAKGNLSLIPKGDIGYEMKNGKRVLVYDPVEGIDFNDPAFKEVARGNPNIGTILVGINDDHIRTAMEDDFIDYIIPFHTGQTEVVRQIKKIGKWQNYKNEQVDKPWDSDSKAKPVNVYTDVIAAAEREGDPIRNERQFVERFLKVCEERGLRPRFSRFLNTNAEGKYVYTKGYYKLLLDFKMFDKDGTYLPQEPVIPEFDADLLHELTEKYVAGEKAKTEAESPAFKRALERVKAEVVGDDEGRMYSIDEDSDTAYLAAVERGDMETAQKMVDKAAKAEGYKIKAYHGTNAEFTVFDKNRVGKGIDQYGAGFYFASNADVTERYGNRKYDVYLSLKKPIRLVSKARGEGKSLYDVKITQTQAYKILKKHPMMYDPEESPLGDFYDDYWEVGPKEWMIKDLAKQYTNIGDLDADVILYRNYPNELHETIREVIGYDGVEVYFEPDEMVDERNDYFYVAWFDNQMKSADPVTYDDNGNVIPLSERFKEDDPDIRYSIEETPETPDVSDSAATDRDLLLAMAEKLVGSEEENRILTNYKSHYDTQKARQERLDELTAEMREQQSIMMYDQSADKRSAAAKRLPDIYKEMGKISEQLADADRKLTEIEGMKAIRNLLKREYAKAREIQKNIYDTRAKVKREAAETTELRRKTRRIYNRVLRLLVSPNRKRNIPYELQGIAAEALKTANMDLEAMKRLEKLEQELTALEREAVPNPEKIAQKEEQIEAQEKKVGKTKDHLQVMIEIFEKAKNIKEGVGRSVYDESALAKLKDLQGKIGNTTIGRMNREQLQALKDFYDIIYTRISNANKMLSEEREATVEEYGSKATTEAHDAKSLKFLSPKAMELKGMANVRQFFWKNMKPLTVFEAIGSDTFTRLFQSVLNGENVWARDIEEARKKIVETRDKYGYDKWELDKRTEVKDKDGKTVRLSLSEMMSLYAYAKRKQAMGHLEGGGFVLDPNATEMAKGKVISFADMERRLNHAERHVVDQLIIGEIASKLTAEQKAYVDEMQTYLTKLGERGNTVSRKLYGIDIFTEEYYFPIKVKSEYLESHTGRTGDPNIKNRGMTKEVTPEADNPLVLQGFDAVMVDHINSMATYHAFVLPVEDLTRVLNYKPSNAKIDEDGNWTVDESRKDYSTLKAVIEEKYGAEANHYIEQLIRDLNGGARRDAASTLLDKGITGFKRASTMASLSVLIQQPTSLIRAAAYIDPKYLFGQASIVDFANHKKLWERLCKYAPVGIIKEMGGYDTGVGARTGDYLNAKNYKTPQEKLEAFFKPERYGGDSNYRAEIFGKGAAYFDEMAWIQMFEACVYEQADKLGKSRDSEEVLKAAGKRFEEVVRRTQVYDSTLTRTEYMRSKDTGMKMATAFMAEPSTIVSMVADAIMKAERGDTAFLRRTAGAVAGAVIINALASSLVYAMRDDDEEKTYGEKYVASVAMEAAEAINPLEYLPYFRDIMSIMKGYEIERTDMTLISNLFQQVELLTNSKRTVGEKVLGVSGAVSAFFGIPLTNLTRDAKGLRNTLMNSVDTERGTAKGMSAALKEEFSGIFGLFDEQTKNEYQLYQAYVSGDTAHYERVKARYKSENAAEQALRQALRDHEPRISEAAEARLSGDLAVYESIVDQIESEGIFDRNIVIRAINNEMLDLKDEDTSNLVPKDETATDEDETAESLYKASDLNNALERGDTEDFTAILAALVQDKVSAGKTEAQARASVKSSITAYWKKLYIDAWSRDDTEERKRIIAILTETGLYGTRNDVATLAQNWVKNSK